MKRVFALVALLLTLLPIAAAHGSFSFGSIDNEQTVCATDTILFIIPVTNGDDQDSFTASLSGDAAKWAVAAPAGFTLDSGVTEQVYVYVTPSSGALPGKYGLTVTVNGQSSGRQDIPLTVNVGDCHSASLTALEVSQDVCADSSAAYSLALVNTGKYTENFALSTSGPLAAQATLSDAVVKLKAGESKEITATVKPTADQTGAFDLTVTARSETSNAAASAKLKVNSNNCYEFALTPDKNYLSFCENSEVTVPLTIRNVGEAVNTFELSVSGPSWATVDAASVDVAPNSEKVANLVFYPGFGVSGDFDAKITAKGKQGGVSETQTVTANVKTCHSTDLKLAAKEDTLCPVTSQTYEVSLVNTGEFDESYSLTVTGADWATLDKNFVDLKAGETAKFNLQISPKDVPAGNYPLTVDAVSQGPSKTSAKDTLVATITPKEGCFGVQTTAALTRVEVAPGEGALIPVIIENKGTQESTYNIEVSGTGAGYVQLNPATLTIAGRQAKTVYMYVAVPEETAQNMYKVTVAARLEDGTVSSSSDVEIAVIAPKTEAPVVAPKPETTQTRVQEKLNTAQSSLDSLREKLRAFFDGLRAKLAGKAQEKVKITVPEEQTEKTAETPGQLTLAKNESQTIEVNGEKHKITAIRVGTDSVSLKIESNTTVVSLVPGQTKEIDLNGDGTKDLRVTYNGQKGGVADISYEAISAPEVAPIIQTNETQVAPTNETMPSNETVTNASVKEQTQTQEQLQAEQPKEQTKENTTLPQGAEALLSSELKKKLGIQQTEQPKSTDVDRLKQNVGKLTSFGTGLGLSGLQSFLIQETYFFPNWLWIAALIIVIVIIGYFLKDEEGSSGLGGAEEGETKTEKKPNGDNLWKKFQNFLEEEDEEKKEEVKEEPKEDKPKKNNKRKGKKEVLIEEEKLNKEEEE